MIAVLLGVGVALAPSVAAVPAAQCPSAQAAGRSIGTIAVSGVEVPITLVSPQPGGVLDPPPSNRVVGLSTAHAQLDATEGTSVLTWHRRYGKGCPGALNPLIRSRIGSTFTIRLAEDEPMTFRIVGRREAPRGQYRKHWFRNYGPHQVLLVTCTDFRDGAFHRTLAVVAERVKAPVPAESAAP